MSLTKATYSMINGAQVNVLDFGAVGDGVTDDTAAFEKAIYESNPNLDSIAVYVPAGDYILSRQIIPRRSILLFGDGFATSRLIFKDVVSLNPTMQGAISFGILTTLNAYTTNPNNYPTRANNVTAGGADQSQINNLQIRIEGTRPAGFNYGIWNSARLTVLNTQLYGCGLKAEAGNRVVGVGNIVGNANLCLYQNVNSLFAPEYAFFCDGDDCNNSSYIRCSAFIPNLIGFFEASGFGNLYAGCHREGVTANTTHGYRGFSLSGVNKSMFLECYNEGDAVTTALWEIDTGISIVGFQGAEPENNLGSGKNTWMTAKPLSGFVTTFQLNVASDGDGFSLGSATVPASRVATDGFFVRAGDDSLGSLARGGDGTYLSRNGATVMKVERGAAIASPTGGATIDTEARTAIDLILARMRTGTPNINT